MLIYVPTQGNLFRLLCCFYLGEFANFVFQKRATCKKFQKEFMDNVKVEGIKGSITKKNHNCFVSTFCYDVLLSLSKEVPHKHVFGCICLKKSKSLLSLSRADCNDLRSVPARNFSRYFPQDEILFSVYKQFWSVNVQWQISYQLSSRYPKCILPYEWNNLEIIGFPCISLHFFYVLGYTYKPRIFAHAQCKHCLKCV